MLSQRCSTVFLPQMPEHLSPLVSIIVPFFNEQDSLVALVREIESQFTAIKHELILVDDGSTDTSLKVALALSNDAIKVVALDGNHGQSKALKAGMDCSTGILLATMDADGQNLSKDLLPMIQLLQSQQGSQIQMVQGIRTMRIDSWQKRLPSWCANFIIRKCLGVSVTDTGCSLRVFRREVLTKMVYFNGFHRYIPVIAKMQGFQVREIPVGHAARMHGISKYGWGRLPKVLRQIALLRIRPQWLVDDMAYKLRVLPQS